MTVFLKNLDLSKFQQKRTNIKKTKTKGKTNQKQQQATSFPVKLHRMLVDVEREGKQSIISWNPDGTTFQVHKNDKFVSEVLPHYFRQSKYKSFQRQLNFYNFQRITSGSFEGSYGHPCFLRGNEELCRSIKRHQASESQFTEPIIKETVKLEFEDLSPLLQEDRMEDGISDLDGLCGLLPEHQNNSFLADCDNATEPELFEGNRKHCPGAAAAAAKVTAERRESGRLSFGGKIFFFLPAEFTDI
jgi:hypothetical protein